MSEFDLIAKYFTHATRRDDVLLNVGDDAAVLRVPEDRRLVAAVDTIVEGVHFPKDTHPSAIGHRALAVNLSDIAAMGAEPSWATLSISLPQSNEEWLEQFASGLYRLADRFNVAVVGGDTVRGPLAITVSIMGLVEPDRWLTRSGAKPGDTIFISGVPGEAAAGLAVLQKGMARSAVTDALVARFLWPEPRIQLGRAIRSLASAAIDVSDGLLADLGHICAMSQCGARIEVESLPQSSMSTIFPNDQCERFALGGGDDYELLFTAPADKLSAMQASIGDSVRCTPIGRVTDDREIACFRNGKRFVAPRRGYDHFS